MFCLLGKREGRGHTRVKASPDFRLVIWLFLLILATICSAVAQKPKANYRENLSLFLLLLLGVLVLLLLVEIPEGNTPQTKQRQNKNLRNKSEILTFLLEGRRFGGTPPGIIHFGFSKCRAQLAFDSGFETSVWSWRGGGGGGPLHNVCVHMPIFLTLLAL